MNGGIRRPVARPPVTSPIAAAASTPTSSATGPGVPVVASFAISSVASTATAAFARSMPAVRTTSAWPSASVASTSDCWASTERLSAPRNEPPARLNARTSTTSAATGAIVRRRMAGSRDVRPGIRVLHGEAVCGEVNDLCTVAQPFAQPLASVSIQELSVITMRDVARLAGVSITTVSHVVNSTRSVAPDTKAKVLDAIEHTGYTGDAIARSLVTGGTRSLGVAISLVANPYFAELLAAIEHETTLSDYTLVLADTHDEPAAEQSAVRTLRSRRVDGLILTPSPRASGTVLPELRTLG